MLVSRCNIKSLLFDKLNIMAWQFIDAVNFSRHVCFTSTQDILPIVAPLQSTFGIIHFSYSRRYKDNSYFILSNTPEFSELFIKQKFYKNSFCASIDKYESQAILGRDLGYDEVTLAAEQSHGLGNFYIVQKKCEDFLETFYFAGTVNNTAINQFYINQQVLLERFSQYFKAKAGSVIKLCDANRLVVPSDGGDLTALNSLNSNISTNSINNFTQDMIRELDKEWNSLTSRELECLYWLSMGKTLDMIAQIIGISLRTVKSYMSSVKNKLECINQFQLGEFYNKYKINLQQK